MKRAFLLLLFTISSLFIYSQSQDSYKLLFYNVENLFDTYNDSLKNDEEFLPEGERNWNKSKYYSKLQHIYKVIVAVGEWNPPAIIGLCEIENRKVLHDLTQNTPLVKYEYEIIHQESPDLRGIDVALLFRKELFNPIQSEFIAINFPNNPKSKTRDILYVKGIANETDTIHVFVNHWPSRWGGQLESEEKRLFVATVLKSKVDSLFKISSSTNIIITGDFNDYPDNKSMREVLKARHEFENIKELNLYNLSSYLSKNKKEVGSQKYQGQWGILDQFIVSGRLLQTNNKIYTTLNDVHIFNADFLLEPDEGYYGYKPYRTFIGYRYNGGFSDHLPTYLILNFNK